MNLVINGKHFEPSPEAENAIIRLMAELSDKASHSPEYLPLPRGQIDAFFHAFRRSPDWKVRQAVARGLRGGKPSADETLKSTIKTLCKDPQVEVVRTLVGNTHVRPLLSPKQLMRLMDRQDAEVNRIIAKDLESFKRCRPKVLAEKLMETQDPHVKQALADSYSTPRKYLEKLMADNDPRIATTAEEILADVEDHEW